MLTVSYNKCCRYCFTRDGFRSSYTVEDGNREVYMKKTEYQVMRQVEEWREEDGHSCVCCGSRNVEICDVEIDYKPLYSFDSLVARSKITKEQMFLFNIDKRDYKLEVKKGGSSVISNHFFMGCLEKIFGLLDDIPNGHLVAHAKGNVFICLIGTKDLNGEYVISVERFRYHGVSKSDVLQAINKIM